MAIQRYRARVTSSPSGVETAQPSNVGDLLALGNTFETATGKIGAKIRRDQIKFGQDYGNEITIDDVITLDETTGKPVAFKTSKLTTQAARDAFEDVVQQRFIQGIDNQFKITRTKLLEEAKYADDPVSYFNNNFNAYAQERLNTASEGFYANKVNELAGLFKTEGAVAAEKIQIERNINEMSASLEVEQKELLEDAASLGTSGANVSAVLAIMNNKSESYNSLKQLNLISDVGIAEFEKNMLSNYYTGRMVNFLRKKDLPVMTVQYIKESLIDKSEIENIPLSHRKRLGTNVIKLLKNYHEFVSYENISQLISNLDGILSSRNSASDGSDANTGGNVNTILNPTDNATAFGIAQLKNEDILGKSARADLTTVPFTLDIGTLSMYEQHYFQEGGIDSEGRPNVLSIDPEDPFGMSPVWIPYAQGNATQRREAQLAYTELSKLKDEKEALFKTLNDTNLPITFLRTGVNFVDNLTEDGGGLKWKSAKGQKQILGFIVDYLEQNVDSVFSIQKPGSVQKIIKADSILEEIILAGKQQQFVAELEAFGNYRQARIDDIDRITKKRIEGVLKETETMIQMLNTKEVINTTNSYVSTLTRIGKNRISTSIKDINLLQNRINEEIGFIRESDSITNKETLINELELAMDINIQNFVVGRINKLAKEFEASFIQENPEALIQESFFELQRRELFEIIRNDFSGNILFTDLQENDLHPDVLKFLRKERNQGLLTGEDYKLKGDKKVDSIKEITDLISLVQNNHSNKIKIADHINTSIVGKIDTNLSRISKEQDQNQKAETYFNALRSPSLLGRTSLMNQLTAKEQANALGNQINDVIITGNKMTLSNLFLSENRDKLAIFLNHLDAEGSVAPIQSVFNRVYDNSAVNVSNEELNDMMTFYRGLRNFQQVDTSASTGFRTVNLTAQFLTAEQIEFFDTIVTLQDTLDTPTFTETVDKIKARRTVGREILKNDKDLKDKVNDLSRNFDPVSQTLIDTYTTYLVGKYNNEPDIKKIENDVNNYLESVMPETDGLIITSATNSIVDRSPYSISILAKTEQEKLDFLTNFVLKDILNHKTIFGNVARVFDDFGDEKLFTVKMGNILKPVTAGYGFQTTVGDYETNSSVLGVSGLNEKNQKVLDSIEEVELFLLPIQDFGNLYSKSNIVQKDADGNQLNPLAMYRQLSADVNYLLVRKHPDLEGEYKPFVWFGVPQVINFKDANNFFKQRAEERFEQFQLSERDKQNYFSGQNILSAPFNIGGF